jgi:hypothetical protein
MLFATVMLLETMFSLCQNDSDSVRLLNTNVVRTDFSVPPLPILSRMLNRLGKAMNLSNPELSNIDAQQEPYSAPHRTWSAENVFE